VRAGAGCGAASDTATAGAGAVVGAAASDVVIGAAVVGEAVLLVDGPATAAWVRDGRAPSEEEVPESAPSTEHRGAGDHGRGADTGHGHRDQHRLRGRALAQGEQDRRERHSRTPLLDVFVPEVGRRGGAGA
jgi:hypothetical protein